MPPNRLAQLGSIKNSLLKMSFWLYSDRLDVRLDHSLGTSTRTGWSLWKRERDFTMLWAQSAAFAPSHPMIPGKEANTWRIGLKSVILFARTSWRKQLRPTTNLHQTNAYHVLLVVTIFRFVLALNGHFYRCEQINHKLKNRRLKTCLLASVGRTENRHARNNYM